MVKIAVIKLDELENKNIKIKDIKRLKTSTIKVLASKIFSVFDFLEEINLAEEFRSFDLDLYICVELHED